ncbi:Crp/Fnr family transcriptional regulator [Rhodoferax sp.]|uniref:Crp/Fnr family transcriptional regulator n=1 Tax=Rhodoferax sp. TaxID=50421 RepID=UPI0026221B48|nr:Crp/Fnr family transcriptional regulator [Rhodoferax sp.]MDD2924875.1 Crp/Fnr family transcriptional regulator [Rhodoferax sp.]
MKKEHAPFNIRAYLSVLPLFADLSDTEREPLVRSCELRRLPRGETVFRVGDPCEAFHVVVVGQVKLYVANAEGQEKIIELVGAGQTFAEAIMFLDKPYFLNVQTLADTLLLSISKQAVVQEIERDPRLAMRMLAGISRRLRGLVQDVESYALHNGTQRLIGYLLREVQGEAKGAVDAGPCAHTVCLPVSKSALASLLSLTPEYFSRVLHELEAEGLIAIDKRDIRILDTQRLASYGSL